MPKLITGEGVSQARFQKFSITEGWCGMCGLESSGYDASFTPPYS